MKKFAIFLAVLMLLVTITGCNNTTPKQPSIDTTQNAWLLQPEYSSMYIGQMLNANTGMFEGKLAIYIVDENGVSRCGYVSENGGFAIEPNYGQLTRFSEGYAAAVPLQGVPNYGVIDEKGTFVTAQQFSSIGTFSDGLASAMLTGTNKHGFINTKGEFAILPMYDMANPFSDGYALVATFDEDTLTASYGFIDKKGEPLSEETYLLAQSFSDQLAAVWVGSDYATARAGFINPKGEYVIEPQFKTVGSFADGLAPAVAADGDLYGFIDKTGAFVIEPQFVYTTGFSEGLAMVGVETDSGEILEGYIDTTGAFVVEPQYYSCQQFRNGYASVATKAQYESGLGIKIIIDKHGNVVAGEDLVLEDGVTIASICYGNIVIVAKDGKYGLMRLKDVV